MIYEICVEHEDGENGGEEVATSCKRCTNFQELDLHYNKRCPFTPSDFTRL